MITIHLHQGGLSQSSSQRFHVIKTHLKHVVIVLGNTCNAYLISIKPRGVFCNCPDNCKTCKHIIFLASSCGFINRRLSYARFTQKDLIQQLHSNPPPPLLQDAFLDHNAAALCSIQSYSPCFFCASPAASMPPQTLIICSRCGFLCHDHCLHVFFANDDNRVKFENHCPRCGKLSVRLSIPFTSGYRNFHSVLHHRRLICQQPHPTAPNHLQTNEHIGNTPNCPSTNSFPPDFPVQIGEPSVQLRDV